MQRINITLPDDLTKDLRRIIPSRSRSKFIAQALSEKLSKKKKNKKFKKEWIKKLKANYEYYKKIGKEWEATEVEGWPD